MDTTTLWPPSPEVAISASVIELPASLQAVGDAGDWMAAWLAPRAVPADTAFAMRLCLEEALANIAMHSESGGDEGGGVSVGASLAEEPGRLVLSISDDGQPFDPVTAALPEGQEIGGNGLLLLRRYCSDLNYRREGGRNRLILGFSLPDGNPAPGR